MPLYEYCCENCGNIDERLEFGNEMEQEHYCSKCDGLASRIVSKCKFKLEYNNVTDMCDWEGNTSQYWKDVKAAKERGEKVKPAGAD